MALTTSRVISVLVQVSALRADNHPFARPMVLLSYHDLEEMMREHGLPVDHTTMWRWVRRHTPEINKRIRQHLKMSGTSYRVDECDRARPQIHQKEGASVAMLQELSHSGANSRRHRIAQHHEEGSDQKVSRKRCDGSGEVRGFALSDRCLRKSRG